MDKNLLPKNFFRDNPLDEMSTARLADFSIRTVLKDDLTNEMNKILQSTMSQSRAADMKASQEALDKLETAEELVMYMRKDAEIMTYPTLCRKALAIQEEVMPLIIKRYLTTAQTCFIEAAVRIFGNADRKYTEELLKEYGNIRNPYAQANACLLFGEFRMTETVPLLLSEYRRFLRNYPDQGYAQCPLFALNILYGEG